MFKNRKLLYLRKNSVLEDFYSNLLKTVVFIFSTVLTRPFHSLPSNDAKTQITTHAYEWE